MNIKSSIFKNMQQYYVLPGRVRTFTLHHPGNRVVSTETLGKITAPCNPNCLCLSDVMRKENAGSGTQVATEECGPSWDGIERKQTPAGGRSHTPGSGLST